MEETSLHRPVMVDEVLEFLRLRNGDKVLDGTVGLGGHGHFMAEEIKPDGLLIGIDRDADSLNVAKRRLEKFKGICRLAHANFLYFDKVFREFGIEKIDAALFDLGISGYQIEKASRGFSFEREGFLDMRMDASSGIRAYDIVNKARRADLERIIRDFGEERYFRRIAGFIVEKRNKAPIGSTAQLAQIIRNAAGRKYGRQKIHPATRTFQALRIAVNKELENLDGMLAGISGFLNPGARVCVISFHSLEDRIVKIRFRELEKKGIGKAVTKKPLRATSGEIAENPRARSAKLRVFAAKDGE